MSALKRCRPMNAIVTMLTCSECASTLSQASLTRPRAAGATSANHWRAATAVPRTAQQIARQNARRQQVEQGLLHAGWQPHTATGNAGREGSCGSTGGRVAAGSAGRQRVMSVCRGGAAVVGLSLQRPQRPERSCTDAVEQRDHPGWQCGIAAAGDRTHSMSVIPTSRSRASFRTHPHDAPHCRLVARRAERGRRGNGRPAHSAWRMDLPAVPRRD
jgi:hypothetical protein